MDQKLLLDLFRIPSQSYKEDKTRNFIMEFLKKEGIEFTVDEMGNVFNISHKDRPLLSAHMDTVQDDFDSLMSRFVTIKKGIVKGYGVIGGDDKCGIYTILDLLANGYSNKINFVFSVQEEVGGMGIEHFVKTNDLSHILYGLILDRRGTGDIICSNNDYGTLEFEGVLETIGKHFGFSKNTGSFSDADYLSEQISCANLSVGYYNPHQKSEYVVIEDLKNTINFTHQIIKNVYTKFDAPAKVSKYNHGNYWFGTFDNDFPTDDEHSKAWACDCCGERKHDLFYISTFEVSVCETCALELYYDVQKIEPYLFGYREKYL